MFQTTLHYIIYTYHCLKIYGYIKRTTARLHIVLSSKKTLAEGGQVTAVEYGENFSNLCRYKFREYPNFSVVTSKFEDFASENNSYDLIYSASAFHWVPEELGYSKVFDLLKKGGVFARFANHPYEDKGRPELSQAIQKVYDMYMPGSIEPAEYSEQSAKERADITQKYGFTDISYKLYHRTRTFTAKEYIALLGTYYDHMTLEDDPKRALFSEIEDAINQYGGEITLYDTIDIEFARKP